MSWTEDDLRRALERRDAPEGFAARVMARLGEPERVEAPVHVGLFARPWWRMATVAASLAVLLTGGLMQYEHQRRERMEAEAARDQLLTALQLTAGKLKLTRARIVGLGERRDGGERPAEGRSE